MPCFDDANDNGENRGIHYTVNPVTTALRLF